MPLLIGSTSIRPQTHLQGTGPPKRRRSFAIRLVSRFPRKTWRIACSIGRSISVRTITTTAVTMRPLSKLESEKRCWLAMAAGTVARFQRKAIRATLAAASITPTTMVKTGNLSNQERGDVPRKRIKAVIDIVDERRVGGDQPAAGGTSACQRRSSRRAMPSAYQRRRKPSTMAMTPPDQGYGVFSKPSIERMPDR